MITTEFVDGQQITQDYNDCRMAAYAGNEAMKKALPTLTMMRDWAAGLGREGKAELRAAMWRAIRSGRLVRGARLPDKAQAERECLEYIGEIACGTWVWLSPTGEVVGAEIVDFPSHDGAGYRSWGLPA